MLINFENGNSIALIADNELKGIINDCFYKSVVDDKENGKLFLESVKEDFKEGDINFPHELEMYLQGHIEREFGVFPDEIKILLKADLEKFIKDPDYAKTTFEENFDIIPEMGFDFWEVSLDEFIDDVDQRTFDAWFDTVWNAIKKAEKELKEED